MPFGLPRKNRGGSQPTSIATDRRGESLAPERIQLALSGDQSTADLLDSGYGPFGLERICRITRGKFFRLRNIDPPDWKIDPTTGDIKSDLLAKYAPDYVDQDQYLHLLAANKCRQALHDAALLPPASGLGSVRTEFPKQQDEAVLAKIVTTAQKAAAIDDQPIQKLYDTLIAAESNRSKLTGGSLAGRLRPGAGPNSCRESPLGRLQHNARVAQARQSIHQRRQHALGVRTR